MEGGHPSAKDGVEQQVSLGRLASRARRPRFGLWRTRSTVPSTVVEGPPSPDLPGLARTASRTSRSGQRAYLGLIVMELVGTMVIAVAGDIGPMLADAGRGLAVAVATLVLASTGVQFFRNRRADSSRWFAGRAAAESVKTAAWRYMVRAAPFSDGTNAEREFEGVLEQVSDRVRIHLGKGVASGQHAATAAMQRVRASDWTERRSIYLNHRLDGPQGQIRWYERGRDRNARWARTLAIASVAGQGAAVVVALAHAFGTFVNVIGSITTLTAAAIAWGQAKRFDELVHSYGLAAAELREMRDRMQAAADERSFLETAIDAENAVSREHTMWVARRITERPDRRPR